MKQFISMCTVLFLVGCSSMGFGPGMQSSGGGSGLGSSGSSGSSSLGSGGEIGSSGTGAGSSGLGSNGAYGTGSRVNYATSLSGAPAPLFDPFLYSGGD